MLPHNQLPNRNLLRTRGITLPQKYMNRNQRVNWLKLVIPCLHSRNEYFKGKRDFVCTVYKGSLMCWMQNMASKPLICPGLGTILTENGKCIIPISVQVLFIFHHALILWHTGISWMSSWDFESPFVPLKRLLNVYTFHIAHWTIYIHARPILSKQLSLPIINHRNTGYIRICAWNTCIRLHTYYLLSFGQEVVRMQPIVSQSMQEQLISFRVFQGTQENSEPSPWLAIKFWWPSVCTNQGLSSSAHVTVSNIPSALIPLVLKLLD